VRRIRGQVEAGERALEEEKGCAEVQHIVVVARSATNSMAEEIIEDHILMHVTAPGREPDAATGAEELIGVVRSYLR
jgi:FrmR/RcnR family transcriptional regulator, repressor of rcnA expression